MEDYLIHLRDEHLTNLISCLYCARVFIDSHKHVEHEKKHICGVSGMLACSNCTVLFNSVNALESHEISCNIDHPHSTMLQEHYPHLSSILNIKADEFMQCLGNNGNYNCCICKFVTKNVHVYLKHLKKKKCRSLVCNNCSQTYAHKMMLCNHFKFHLECCHIPNNTVCKRKCIKCNQMIDAAIIKFHRKRCKAIKCATCEQAFESVSELTDHQRMVHPMALTLNTCRYCLQVFGGLKLLRRHMKRLHSDYRMYKYTCVYCSRIFKHPNLLFNHFNTKHKELLPFFCKLCNEHFKLRRKFTLHIKLKHNSVGFVEIDDKFSVYFSSEKSLNPFQPKENPTLFNDDEKQSDESDATDLETDTEIRKKTLKSKPFGTQGSKLKPGPVVAHTETDTESDNKTENTKRLEKIEPLTRKRRRLQKVLDNLESSDDESLLAVKKRAKKMRKMQILMTKINKHKFSNRICSLTCNICKKTFFTTAKYHSHMVTHYKSEPKDCTKCGETFASKASLHEHLQQVHSISQITDTLKKLLERRKMATLPPAHQDVSMSDKFRKTVIKFEMQPDPSLKPAGTNSSAKNFLESFTPEVTDSGKKSTFWRPPKIKLHRFVETNYPENRGLLMPQPFSGDTSIVKATIKLHQGPHKTASLNFGTEITATQKTSDSEDNYQGYSQEDAYADDDACDQNASIPEMAHEVMLENTEEHQYRPTGIPHKLVLPKTKQKIKIAHLQMEAPFFKIVALDEVLKGQDQDTEALPARLPPPSEICLPSGKKLVHANPLAHLLDNKSLEKLRKVADKKQKYYQPKHDHRIALEQALMKMEAPPPLKRKPCKKKLLKKKDGKEEEKKDEGKMCEEKKDVAAQE